MLHLQGYGHEQAAEAARMEAHEIAILAGLGFANPYAVHPASATRLSRARR
jgi:probable rRNA maturation factor